MRMKRASGPGHHPGAPMRRPWAAPAPSPASSAASHHHGAHLATPQGWTGALGELADPSCTAPPLPACPSRQAGGTPTDTMNVPWSLPPPPPLEAAISPLFIQGDHLGALRLVCWGPGGRGFIAILAAGGTICLLAPPKQGAQSLEGPPALL